MGLLLLFCRLGLLINAVQKFKRDDVELFVDEYEMEPGCDIYKCYSEASLSDIVFVVTADDTFKPPRKAGPDWVAGEISAALAKDRVVSYIHRNQHHDVSIKCIVIIFQVVPVVYGKRQKRGLPDRARRVFPYSDPAFTRSRHITLRPWEFGDLQKLKDEVEWVLREHNLAREDDDGGTEAIDGEDNESEAESIAGV